LRGLLRGAVYIPATFSRQIDIEPIHGVPNVCGETEVNTVAGDHRFDCRDRDDSVLGKMVSKS